MGLPVLLAACSTQEPVPVDERSVYRSEIERIEHEVRAPARAEGAGVQVYPLRNPGVSELREQAAAAERDGDLEQAAMLLERAMRLAPQDPELMQHMAEVQLARGDYEQALSLASRSYDSGPKVGELCARNWRTISLAREHLGNSAGAVIAEARAAECGERKAPGF